MTIAQTRFWIDRDSRQIGIRSANRHNDTQPFECWLNKYASWLDFKFYESTEDSRVELRLSFALLWFSLNMLIWIFPERENGHRCDDRDRAWGWHFMDRCHLVLHWGERRIGWDLPFVSWQCEASQIMSLTRNRVAWDDRGKKFLDTFKARQDVIEQNSAKCQYVYELLNGERQEVTATLHVLRHVRRRKWTPFRRNDDGIWVEFSEEVGPERGSWKGGCTGCGYTLKPKETAIHCLRRMERERRFER